MTGGLVVLDARLTRQMSVGMKAYVRELAMRLPAVAPDLRFTVVTNADLRVGPGASLQRVSERMASNASLAEQIALPRLLRRLRPAERDRPCIAHYMSVYAPRWSPLPHLYTIHDLIHLRYPEYFSWKIRLYYRFVVSPVARGSRAVLTDAKATLPDLERFLGVAPAGVRVVPLGVDDRFRLDEAQRASFAAEAKVRLGLTQPYFLYAGNHRAHKNLETLARAWQQIKQPCDLVVTEDAPFAFDIDRYPRENGRIVRPGHVEVDLLSRLYAGCAAAVQPSLYEGFGLSAVEAMAAGAPVIVAETPALLEVAGDAALTFPPRDAEALSLALVAALAGGEALEGMRARGRQRAASYTWDATARLTAQVYREVLEG
ncbi:MAG TPA: glycosyltransferase family 1 protein [Candidatus Tumulicola sp.]|nr:glycosyltransferase family 1 protein [Candidatus Tumulicola sp.]